MCGWKMLSDNYLSSNVLMLKAMWKYLLKTMCPVFITSYVVPAPAFKIFEYMYM